ncbi:sugar ABC transporter permease [Nonomuraea sp. NBC_01738]|uniref:carbohydrate ABC transporter permease n=1 Tax=Nonomuraea sp. NBC_01738 TaxID=2976003 RepID=UPI002E1186AB|nr:sugar ABC transporter permease [Nonomuraea sp. NBC_01738]
MTTAELTGAGQAAPVSRPGTLWRRIRDNRWTYAYLTPFVVLTVVFVIYPIFASLGYTLYEWNGLGDPTEFIGLKNFADVVADEFFWSSFQHAAIYTVVLVPVQLVLALALALVLNNPKLRGSTFYRAIYFLPAITSVAIVGIVLKLMISNFSEALSEPLVATGLTDQPLDFLGNPDTVLWVIIGIGIWNTLGYNMVYFLAGLQTIPKEQYEAAQIDGAGKYAQFRHVTIPGLRSVGLVILFLAIIGSLQVFDLVMVMSGGGPYFASEVVNTYIYHQAFGGSIGSGSGAEPNVGYASAASFFFGIILLLLTLGQMWAIKVMRARRGEKEKSA